MRHLEDNQTAEQPAAARARLWIPNRLRRLLGLGTAGLISQAQSAYHRWRECLVRRSRREQPRPANLDAQDRIFTELAAQRDFDDAIRLLLRRLIPNPQQGFAAVVESAQIDDQPLRSRGLSQESRRTLSLGDDIREALTFQRSLTLVDKELRDHEIFQKLAVCDRRKIEQLYLLRLGDARSEFDVLITTELFPVDLSPTAQMAFAEDTVALLSGLWTKNRTARAQLAKRETDEAFAALRVHMQPFHDNPRQIITQYVDQLQNILDIDRVSLLVPHGTASMIRLAVSGPAMPRGIDKTWRQHENTLAAACVDQGDLLRFDTSALRALAIDTLIGGAVTAPIMIEHRVVAVLCLTSRSGWPMPVRSRQLVHGCAECIQETIVKLSSPAEGDDRALTAAATERRAPAADSDRYNDDGQVDASRLGEDQSVRDKSEFLATMSYEVTHPRHEFWDMIPSLSETGHTETQHEDLEPPQTTSEAFLTLVDDIQDSPEAPRGWCVLLADDDPISRLIGRETLHKHGHQVTVVRNGADALAAVEQGEFDIVLLDLHLPNVDGLPVAQRIRRLERMQNRRLHLIAMTGELIERAQSACREADIDACLAKPLDIHVLRTTLAELAETRSMPAGPFVGAKHSPSVIQYEALLARVEGDTLLAKELLEMFVTGGCKYLADIRAAIEKRNFHEARHAALQLNGAALNIGANALATISLRMDEVDAGRIDDAKAIYRDLEQAIEQLQQYATLLD